MTEPGCFLANGEWSDRQIPTPVSPPGERYREGAPSLITNSTPKRPRPTTTSTPSIPTPPPVIPAKAGIQKRPIPTSLPPEKTLPIPISPPPGERYREGAPSLKTNMTPQRPRPTTTSAPSTQTRSPAPIPHPPPKNTLLPPLPSWERACPVLDTGAGVRVNCPIPRTQHLAPRTPPRPLRPLRPPRPPRPLR